MTAAQADTDWIAVGAKAYILRDHNQAGIGNYLTAHLVRVDSVTATLVRVSGPGTNGETMTFRRATMEASGTRGTWTGAAALAAPHDPRVRRVRKAGSVLATLDWISSQLAWAAPVTGSSAVEVGDDPAAAVQAALAELKRIAVAVEAARARLKQIDAHL